MVLSRLPQGGGKKTSATIKIMARHLGGWNTKESPVRIEVILPDQTTLLIQKDWSVFPDVYDFTATMAGVYTFIETYRAFDYSFKRTTHAIVSSRELVNNLSTYPIEDLQYYEPDYDPADASERVVLSRYIAATNAFNYDAVWVSGTSHSNYFINIGDKLEFIKDIYSFESSTIVRTANKIHVENGQMLLIDGKVSINGAGPIISLFTDTNNAKNTNKLISLSAESSEPFNRLSYTITCIPINITGDFYLGFVNQSYGAGKINNIILVG